MSQNLFMILLRECDLVPNSAQHPHVHCGFLRYLRSTMHARYRS